MTPIVHYITKKLKEIRNLFCLTVFDFFYYTEN